jgi:hypothetical protein
VLTSARVNQRRVRRRLTRAGYAVAGEAGSVRVSRHGRGDEVDATVCDLARLPDRAIASATRLLGLPPRDGITCSFDGRAGESDAWSTVVGIARAVAAEVPLAVLDDHAGTTYLVHPHRGLIGPEEYEQARRTSATSDLLRRMLGGS